MILVELLLCEFPNISYAMLPPRVARNGPKVWKWTNVRWNSPEIWHPPTCRIVNNDLPDGFLCVFLHHEHPQGFFDHEGCSWHLVSLSESQGNYRWQDVTRLYQEGFKLKPYHIKRKANLILPSSPKKTSLQNPSSRSSVSPHLVVVPQ